MASDGTLRLLALSLPAYIPDFEGVFLIEEPENGIHPKAVETAFQSLSSAYNAQILMATHSPVILSLVEASKVLCFAKTEEGSTDIVTGDQHPKLIDWRGTPDLSVLFAAGVLGGNRASAIAIDPELDVWIWSESPYVDEVLGWTGHDPSLRKWLFQEGWLIKGQTKPNRPKEALESALRIIRQPRSSSIYKDIAEKVSLKRCLDPSFLKLKNILTNWFKILDEYHNTI
jgi:hypothetical protein